jgi:3-dehydroquinate synthase
VVGVPTELSLKNIIHIVRKMKEYQYRFSSGNCSVYLDASFANLPKLVPENFIFITDEIVFQHHATKFDGYKTIVVKAGEENKQQSTVDNILRQLITLEADRKTFIVGVGGGVVTDMAGYAASVYMRGLKFGFVPTTILAMVDAAIGGKNGVDVGAYKNLVGTFRQPQFLLYDYSFLQTLPLEQWVNGFAEIIKHACIKDEDLFNWLKNKSIQYFQHNANELATLIEKNVQIKSSIVTQDEFEQGDRKLLNFGHTFGHAIENENQLLHGHAISIGMMIACTISEEINQFTSAEKAAVQSMLEQYHLPTSIKFEKQKVWDLMKMDKKRVSNTMSFILLNKIGEAVVKQIPLVQLEDMVSQNL